MITDNLGRPKEWMRGLHLSTRLTKVMKDSDIDLLGFVLFVPFLVKTNLFSVTLAFWPAKDTPAAPLLRAELHQLWEQTLPGLRECDNRDGLEFPIPSLCRI